jgi:hypothetical protein
MFARCANPYHADVSFSLLGRPRSVPSTLIARRLPLPSSTSNGWQQVCSTHEFILALVADHSWHCLYRRYSKIKVKGAGTHGAHDSTEH